jgi:AraC family transcriptional regulator
MANIKVSREEYIGRINKVLDYVENNLDKELPLEYVSNISCYSPFHFHRIFTSIVGETINAFITRKRLEKIASMLLNRSDIPITDLAFNYGFKSGSSFSRAFNNYYGMSPTEFREKGADKNSKIRKVESKNGKGRITFEKYICGINNIKKWIKMNAQIEVKEMPELKLVYIDHIGEFNQIGGVYEKLMRWAGPKGLLGSPEMKTITVYHDDPKVTEMSKVRQSAGITVQKDVKVDMEVGTMTLPKGTYAVGRFEIPVTGFENAWNSMCVWVAESGYSARDGNYYELYHNNHMQHPEQKFILDICIPVE